MPRSDTARLVTIDPTNSVFTQQLATLREDAGQPYRQVCFSPDGQTLASSTLETVTLWDVAAGQPRVSRRISALDLAFSPDGRILAAASKDIAFLDARSLQPLASLTGHRSGTQSIAFNPDGSLLASGGMDGMVRVGELRSKKLLRSFEHQAPVRGVAFSPDGALLASIAWGEPEVPSRVYLWRVRDGKKLGVLRADKEKHLHFSPDGAILAIDGRLFDMASGQQRADLNDRVIAFSPDGTLIASCRSDFNTIGLWQTADHQKLGVLKGHAEAIWSLAFSPDGRLLASGSGKLDMRALIHGEGAGGTGDKTIRLWGVVEDDLPATRPLERKTDSLRALHDAGETRPLKPNSGELKRLYEQDEADESKPNTNILRRLWK